MKDLMSDYEEAKRAIRLKRAGKKREYEDLDEFDYDLPEGNGRRVGLVDVAQVGSKVLIGGGVGLLAGVATIAVAAGAAEVVIAGVVTKITGLIGGALGLTMGLKKYKRKWRG